MAKDSLLGKDLVISFTTAAGGVMKLELDKFDPEPKFETINKHPLGESAEHQQTVWKGWEISVSGHVVDNTPDKLINTFEKKANGETIDTANDITVSDVRTTEMYSDGTVQKWRYYSEDGPVRSSDFKVTGGDGKDPRKFEFKIFAKRRKEVV